MQERVTDVLIVGGGPVGLISSIVLADLGISSILVERRAGKSRLPKAHYLNSRSMEIFDHIGFADEIYEAGASRASMAHNTYHTSLGGDGPADRQVLMTVDSWGGGDLRERYDRDSACRGGNLAQKDLEPRLRRVAEERNPGDVLFEHELVALEPDDTGVTGTVRSADDELSIRSRYVIAADGGRTVGDLVDIQLEGPPVLGRAVTFHFAADLSPWLQDDSSLLRAICRVTEDGTPLEVALVASGPNRWDRSCETWVLNLVSGKDDPMASQEWTDELAAAAVKDVLKLPDLDLEMLSIGGWNIESVLADRFRSGPVFVAGDAAHRHPPVSALGLNTGIGDAHNLCWKLAAVVNGDADEKLLDSYEAERRPVAARVIQWAMLTTVNHLTTSQAAWGIAPGADPEHRVHTFESIFADTPDGASRRARLGELLHTLRIECQHHDIEMGYDYYSGGAVLQDGSPPPDRDPLGLVYVPTARPGHRVPHAWFEHGSTRTSTHQLLRPGRFMLLTGSDGDAWRSAAAMLAREGNPGIDVFCVGADLTDLSGAWSELCGVDNGGAVLIRPDGHVAMRAAAAPDDHEATLAQGLATSLGRGITLAGAAGGGG